MRTRPPWAINERRIESEFEHGIANGGWIIAEMHGPDFEDNAVLIVKAVNSYDLLKRENKSLKRELRALRAYIKTLQEER